MMLHRLHSWVALAILCWFCPNSGEANAYVEQEVPVSTYWHRTKYDNNNLESVTLTITRQAGIRRRHSNTRSLTAAHGAGVIAEGDLFNILSIELYYTFMDKHVTAYMSEDEIYSARNIEARVTIPPRSTLIRWELIAEVAGTTIDNKHYIDTFTDNDRTPQTEISIAKVRVRRRINYGHTLIRIKHLERSEYITIVSHKSWPAATLGNSSSHLFVLCEDERGYRLKTLNTTHPGYVWAYPDGSRGVYFDFNRPIGYSKDSNVNLQHWLINKEEPYYDGDVVTFKNKYYEDSAMSYYEGYTTNVYSISGREDKWVLETADERDSSINSCQ